MDTPAVSIIIQRPEMENQIFTPTFSAMGLLNSKPIGMVTDEISVRAEKARPIFSEDMVSCIYAVSGMVWTFPEAPSPMQPPAKINQPAYAGGIIPQNSDIIPIPNRPINEALIFRFTVRMLENKMDDTIIPTANDNSAALPYMADNLK